MKSIFQMKTLQRIGILFLLSVFLFGTTGISVLHHICSSSNKHYVTVYPEIFKNAGSSCCEDESTGYMSANHGYDSRWTMPQNISSEPCCKNIASFFKLQILTERVEKLKVNVVSAQQFLLPVSISLLPNVAQLFLQPAHFQFYSPPLFGKLLVHFLHQMKIPAHPSLA